LSKFIIALEGEDKAFDAIGDIFAAIITVSDHLIDVFVQLAPGVGNSPLDVTIVWMLGIAIIAMGFKYIMELRFR
jgi:hypothetical protein